MIFWGEGAQPPHRTPPHRASPPIFEILNTPLLSVLLTATERSFRNAGIKIPRPTFAVHRAPVCASRS